MHLVTISIQELYFTKSFSASNRQYSIIFIWKILLEFEFLAWRYEEILVNYIILFSLILFKMLYIHKFPYSQHFFLLRNHFLSTRLYGKLMYQWCVFKNGNIAHCFDSEHYFFAVWNKHTFYLLTRRSKKFLENVNMINSENGADRIVFCFKLNKMEIRSCSEVYVLHKVMIMYKHGKGMVIRRYFLYRVYDHLGDEIHTWSPIQERKAIVYYSFFILISLSKRDTQQAKRINAQNIKKAFCTWSLIFYERTLHLPTCKFKKKISWGL